MVKQDQPNANGSNKESHQAADSRAHRQVIDIDSGHALSCCDMQVDSATECQENADGVVTDFGGHDDDSAKQHAHATHKIHDQRCNGPQLAIWTCEHQVVCQLLGQLVGSGSDEHLPAEVAAAALESSTHEEAVADVVEEVAYQDARHDA